MLTPSTTSQQRKAPMGSVAIQVGGCGGKTPDCLPITPRRNYIVRLSRPRAEILGVGAGWRYGMRVRG